jgi:hypothetical protein
VVEYWPSIYENLSSIPSTEILKILKKDEENLSVFLLFPLYLIPGM